VEKPPSTRRRPPWRSLEGYRYAVVFHHGARGGELLARVSCSYVEFFP